MSSSGGYAGNSIEEESDRASWEWVRYQTITMDPAINFYYKSKIWNKIKDKLMRVGNKALLRRFESGCFGHLLKWRDKPCSAQATHAVVARQIVLEGALDHELWFRVCGQNVRFSYMEYALVTGLRFGPSSFDPNGWHDPENVGVFKRFCGGNNTTVRYLLALFESGVPGATHDDYLKVANLLALYMFGLGYDPSKVVESFAWVLVDDLEAWNRFPWGGYTYQALMYYVSRVAITREECGQRYHFYGPVWALQVWAYEAIPDLARVVAVADKPDALPRCLRWVFIKPKVRNYKVFFNNRIQNPCLRTLLVEANEVQQEYWKSVNRPNPVGVSYIEPFNQATARIGIEGPIRYFKLTKRRNNISKVRDAELQRQMTADIAQRWEERERNVILKVEKEFLPLFKDTLHTEMKKVILSVWRSSRGASSSGTCSPLAKNLSIPLDLGKCCKNIPETSVYSPQQLNEEPVVHIGQECESIPTSVKEVSQQETSLVVGEECESTPEDTPPVPPRRFTRSTAAENTEVVRPTDPINRPTTKKMKLDRAHEKGYMCVPP